MVKSYGRTEVLARLQKEIDAGRPVIISSAGDGLMAKLEEMGGIDIIGVYNSGWMRHYGVGSLGGLMPIVDTNRAVVDLAQEIIPRVKETPVIAGVCAQDPRTIWGEYLSHLRDIGFSGIMNFPTVGLIDADSKWRTNLEESGFGYDKEVAVLKQAHEMGLFTIGYCFTPKEAKMVAGAGVDILACHVGLTAGGTIGAKTVMSKEDAIRTTTDLINAAKEVRTDFIPITHGGPMATPGTTEPILMETEAKGYLGASSIERTPVEPAIIDVVKQFKGMHLRR